MQINGHTIALGERTSLDLPVGSFTTHEPVFLHTKVIRGKRPGPTLLLTACIHGDEINGTEIIRRLLKSSSIKKLRGTLIAVPIVNVPAYINRSRYLPDRRDLNRLFPGSTNGSLGARLASVLTQKLLSASDYIIDFHTGAVNRPNLPQIRVTAGDKTSIEMAQHFSPPVTLLAQPRENSFRTICQQLNKPIILFESGEALRLDTPSIRFGYQGVLTVMRQLEMLPPRRSIPRSKKHVTVLCERSLWERAPAGGLFVPFIPLGRAVEKNQVLGFIADPLSDKEIPVKATRHGIIIGRTNEGQADEGDALFHIAITGDPEKAADHITQSEQRLPSLNEDEDDHPVAYDPFKDTI